MTGNNNTGIQKLQCFKLAFYAVDQEYTLTEAIKIFGLTDKEIKSFTLFYQMISSAKDMLKKLVANKQQLNIEMIQNIKNNMLTLDQSIREKINKLVSNAKLLTEELYIVTDEFAKVATGILSDPRVQFDIQIQFGFGTGPRKLEIYGSLPEDLATKLQQTMQLYGMDIQPKFTAENYLGVPAMLKEYAENMAKLIYCNYNSWESQISDLGKTNKLDRDVLADYQLEEIARIKFYEFQVMNTNEKINQLNDQIKQCQDQIANLENENSQVADFTFAVLAGLL